MAKQQFSIWGNGDSEGRTDGPMAACTLGRGSYLMQPQLHISSWWGAKRRHFSLTLPSSFPLSLSSIPAKCERATEEQRLPEPLAENEREALFACTWQNLSAPSECLFHGESHGQLDAQT